MTGTSVPVTYALDRPCPLPTRYQGRDLNALDECWTYSAQLLHRMRDCLIAEPPPAIVSVVAVAGSLGRMEGSPLSDADVMILLDDTSGVESSIARHAYQAVWKSLAPLGLELPQPDGIYASAVGMTAILDPKSIGQVNEDLQPFGTRFQFLLEAQPVFGAHAHAALTEAIVRRFGQDFVALDPEKEWTYLLNELIRYFRSLCLTYQWKGVRDDFPLWRMRNIKAKHSRLLLYAGLLLLLGESSREKQDKLAWLTPRLRFTPLERICHVYRIHEDLGCEHVAARVNDFLDALRDPEMRPQLRETIADETALPREANPVYQTLKQNGDGLLRELLRFVLERRGSWSERFWEYLIF